MRGHGLVLKKAKIYNKDKVKGKRLKKIWRGIKEIVYYKYIWEGEREGFKNKERHLYNIKWMVSNHNHDIPVMGIILQF